MCTNDDDSLDMDDTIITDNEHDRAADMLETAANCLRRINADITAERGSFVVGDAIEYTKTTALIGIGHALNAIAQALTDNSDDDTDPDVADMLTRNIITNQFPN